MSSKTRRWLIHCRIAFLRSGLARAEAPKLNGVILTCSLSRLNPKCFDLFCLTLSICLGLFSGMEGFGTKGLVKVFILEESDVKAFPLLVAQFHICTTVQISRCIPLKHLPSCYLLHKWLFALSQHLFLLLYYVIKAAEEVETQSLHADTPEC